MLVRGALPVLFVCAFVDMTANRTRFFGDSLMFDAHITLS